MNVSKELITEIFAECLSRQIKIVTVESCTGGLISSTITNFPGSSAVFDRGFVTYSNQSKCDLIGVSKNLIESHGAVSQEVVTEMALNPVKFDKENIITIAISGVAGPNSSENKPVGLVWLASFKENHLLTKELRLGPIGREEIRNIGTREALNLLLENLKC